MPLKHTNSCIGAIHTVHASTSAETHLTKQVIWLTKQSGCDLLSKVISREANCVNVVIEFGDMRIYAFLVY